MFLATVLNNFIFSKPLQFKHSVFFSDLRFGW